MTSRANKAGRLVGLKCDLNQSPARRRGGETSARAASAQPLSLRRRVAAASASGDVGSADWLRAFEHVTRMRESRSQVSRSRRVELWDVGRVNNRNIPIFIEERIKFGV